MTNEISLNDDTDFGLCFACGPRNNQGLQLRFERDGGLVRTCFTPKRDHQGFPGYVHGGVITALLDEVMNRVSLLENQWTITGKLEVRFRRPILLTHQVNAVAQKTGGRGSYLQAVGYVKLPNGEVMAEGKGTFIYLSEQSLSEMSSNYPVLSKTWMRHQDS